MATRGAISAWRAGWHLLWRNKRMWLLVWAVHVAGAVVLAGIFSSTWSDLLGDSLAAGEFGGPQTANILVDLFAHHGEALRGLFPGAALLASPIGFLVILYAWLGMIMAAGILGGLSRSVPVIQDMKDENGGAADQSTEASAVGSQLAARRIDLGLPFLGRFLRDCGTHAGRFTRLMVMQLVAMAVILLTLLAFLGRVSDAFLGPYPDPAASTHTGIVELAVVIFAYLVLTMAGDYAKVRLIREQRRSAILAWGAGLLWAMGRLPRTLGLHLFFVLLAVSGSALYWYVSSLGDLGGTVVALALVQQAYLLFRAGLRVHWYAAELSLFEGLR